MITRGEERERCDEAIELLKKAAFTFAPQEHASMRAADFGLSRLRKEGIQVLTFLNTAFLGAKALILLPEQTMVEHWHPARGDDPGKEETLRCLYGECNLYIPGEDNMTRGFLPEGQELNYNSRHEITLTPQGQYTLSPGVAHWFQPGPEGCVVLSLSTQVTDLDDLFTNPQIVRETKYGG